MKVEQEREEFKPVKITLESGDEVGWLSAAIGESVTHTNHGSSMNLFLRGLKGKLDECRV